MFDKMTGLEMMGWDEMGSKKKGVDESDGCYSE